MVYTWNLNTASIAPTFFPSFLLINHLLLYIYVIYVIYFYCKVTFPGDGGLKNPERGKKRDRRLHTFCLICNNTDNNNDNNNNMCPIYDKKYIRGDRRTYRTLHFRGWIRAAAQTAAKRRKGFISRIRAVQMKLRCVSAFSVCQRGGILCPRLGGRAISE